MKSIVKYLLIVVLGAGAMVFADGGLACPTCGQPPNGIGLDGNAQGTKLEGVIFIEFYDLVFHPETVTIPIIPAHSSAEGRFVLRLRKGSDFEVFYTEAEVADISDPALVQNVIMASHDFVNNTTLQSAVLARFFGRTDLTVKLKNIDQFGRINTPTTVPTTQSIFNVSNLVLAVQ